MTSPVVKHIFVVRLNESTAKMDWTLLTLLIQDDMNSRMMFTGNSGRQPLCAILTSANVSALRISRSRQSSAGNGALSRYNNESTCHCPSRHANVVLRQHRHWRTWHLSSAVTAALAAHPLSSHRHSTTFIFLSN